MKNIMVGTIAVCVDYFFPADLHKIDSLVSCMEDDDQIDEIIDYLREMSLKLEDNILYLERIKHDKNRKY